MRAVFAFLLLLSSCAALEGSPYVGPRAAVFQDGDSLVVRFSGHGERVLSVLGGSGEVAAYVVRDGGSVCLSHLFPGEYSVIVRDRGAVVFAGRFVVR
jgi:hypothetical protein